MDWLENLLTANKIPLGVWVGDFVEWFTDTFEWFFEALSAALDFLVEGLVDVLDAFPAVVLILLIAGLAYGLQRSWRLVAFIVVGLLLILNFGFWDEMLATLSLVLFATFFSLLIGVPTGIYAARKPVFYSVLSPILDLMQTLPTFVYLIPTMILFGLGLVPGLVSTIIFAVAAPIRNTHLGIVSVPKPLIEAGEAFGATRRQLLWKVELPCAMPQIMLGINQCIMLSLSMVVIAALVGAGGLGVPVVRALNTVNFGLGFESGLAIVILAIMLDRVLKRPQTSAGAGKKP